MRPAKAICCVAAGISVAIASLVNDGTAVNLLRAYLRRTVGTV